MADYENFYASLVTFIKAFNASVDSGTPKHSQPEFVDFDQHVAAKTLPHKDIIGFRGMTVAVENATATVNVLFGVSTVEDVGGFRHRKYIDQLLDRVLPTKRIELKDANNGVVLGYMIARSGTNVFPMSKTETRSFQQISVTLLADRKLGP